MPRVLCRPGIKVNRLSFGHPPRMVLAIVPELVSRGTVPGSIKEAHLTRPMFVEISRLTMLSPSLAVTGGVYPMSRNLLWGLILIILTPSTTLQFLPALP